MLSIGNQSSSLPPRTDCVGGYTPNSAAPTGTGGNFKGYVPVEVHEAFVGLLYSQAINVLGTCVGCNQPSIDCG